MLDEQTLPHTFEIRAKFTLFNYQNSIISAT